MLEEVGEAGAARGLVGGADVVPDVDRHLRQPVIGAEDDGQAVGELVLLEGDGRVGGARGDGQRHGGEGDGETAGLRHGDLQARGDGPLL